MEPQSEKPSKKRPPGRESQYTKERGETVCRMIETSIMGLHRLHEKDPTTFPDPTTFYRWLDDHEELRTRYARAKQNQAHFFAEEIIRISYNDEKDVLRTKALPTATGDKILVQEENREFVNRSKLKVDTLWKLMQKLAPKVYGDMLENLERDITIRVIEE